MIDAEPKEVADSLADTDRLPDLGGFSVVFQGLGETVLPEPTLDAARRSQVEQLWTTIATRAGAVTVEVERSQEAVPLEGDLPAVRVVDPGPGVSCTRDSLTLQGGAVDFPAGDIRFIDRGQVIEVLRPFARQMVERTELIAEVFGYHAAVGDPKRVTELSTQRAQEVANVLIELGVPVDQLRVEGFGSNSPRYVPDRDPEGALDPAAAALNRWIVVHFTAPVNCG
jgi:outer membrane protein OmpA-like peptidoglycan-associated protein